MDRWRDSITSQLPPDTDLETWGPVGAVIELWLHTADSRTAGTPKDWYYILEGLLEQETSLRPTEIVSDTAGASELAFGIFRLLGWQFSPRLADVGSASLYGPIRPRSTAVSMR
jgi:hypothetical protein